MIDLSRTDEQEEFGQSVAAVVERHDAVGAVVADADLWHALAELGVLGICTPAVGGSLLDLTVAMGALGARTCPGPLVAVAAASLVLSGDDLDAVVNGDLRVSLVGADLVPWAEEADLLLELAADGAWRVAVDDPEPVVTLSGEPWSRGRSRRLDRLGDPVPAAAAAELALAAYLLGAATNLVERAAEHARERIQFKRPIGDFQAVAHPLARSHAESRAAAELVGLMARGAADLADARAVRAQAAHTSALAGDRAHQAFGAVGFALETGVAATTTRIRQWASLPTSTI